MIVENKIPKNKLAFFIYFKKSGATDYQLINQDNEQCVAFSNQNRIEFY